MHFGGAHSSHCDRALEGTVGNELGDAFFSNGQWEISDGYTMQSGCCFTGLGLNLEDFMRWPDSLSFECYAYRESAIFKGSEDVPAWVPGGK